MKGYKLIILLLFIQMNPLLHATNLPKQSHVSLNFQEAPIALILQALADYQQLNLVITPEIKSTLTLRLEAVPWAQALAVVLRAGKLAAVQEGNIIMVFPQSEAEKYQQQEVALQSATVVLKHAQAEQIKQMLSASYSHLLSEKGSVAVDTRTNSLLLHDTKVALKAITHWLAALDVPIAQVQLAAHIVTINSDSLRELGVRWEMVQPQHATQPLRINNFNIHLPLEKSAVKVGFQLARINSRLLDLELMALEQENKVEIVASPRLLTMHQHTASIKQGTEIPYSVANGSNGATSIEFREAVLGMEVTPQILPGGRVTLVLNISQNMPGQVLKQANGEALTIDKQEIKTQVTVKEGETVVLGGIFQRHSRQGVEKVPGLNKIPLLGALFKRTSTHQQKRELVIFITPTLIQS